MRRLALILPLLLLAGCQYQLQLGVLGKCQVRLPEQSRQAVVVGGGEATPSGMAIRLYEEGGSGWQQVGPTIPAVVGRNGLAPIGSKREGDGQTPSGIFPLKRGFGYGALFTRIPYIVLTREMIWIDDVRSARYNTLTDRKDGEGLSHEIMRRDDDLYKYGVVIEYNTEPVVPGAGSAIFFHIWRNPATATAGCVATAEPDMVRLLQWLDPSQHPMAIIGDACP